jgi:membrane-bound metal-dependent hydrolase YbcI (DUF457 family)
MPFTISHAAAALPFRRTRLIMSALVIGCFGPDLEYFLWLRPHGHLGHSLPGLVLFDLPACLVALFLFHRYAKVPLVACLPARLRERIRNGGRLEIGSISKFALVCVSILVGSATHILWDSFTHDAYWLGRHWHFLKENIRVPLFGYRDWASIFQYASSVFGIVVILLWFVYWYRNTPPDHLEKDRGMFSRDRIVVAGAFVAAILVGLARAAISGLPNGVHGGQRFLTDASVAGITTFCLEILVYGYVHNRFSNESEAA